MIDRPRDAADSPPEDAADSRPENATDSHPQDTADSPLHGQRLFVFVLAVLVGYGLVHVVAGLIGVVRFGAVDFKAYYLAGRRAAAGYPLYEPGPFLDLVADPFARKYLYPPIVVLLFVPFSFLPIPVAYLLWCAVGLGTLLVGTVALLRSAGVELDRTTTAVVCLAVLGYTGTVQALRHGQITLFATGVLSLSLAVTRRGGGRCGDGRLGGALTALGALPKAFYAPAGAHLVRDRNRLLGAVAAVIGLFGAGLVLFGVETHRAYLTVLTAGKGWGNNGVGGVIPWVYRPFHRFGDGQLVVQAVVVVVTGVTAVATRDRSGRHVDDTVAALGLVTIALAAPSANDLTLLLALPAFVLALLIESRVPDGRPWLVAGALLLVQTNHYVLLLINYYGPTYAPVTDWPALAGTVLWLQPATIGLLALFGLLVWRAWSLGDA